MGVERIGALVPPTVDNIGIAVTDLDAAVSFYEQLGFEVDRYSSEEAAVRPASESAYLYVFETNNETTTHRDAELFDNPVGIDHISVRVDDVDQTYRNRKEDVAFFLEPTTDEDWGPAHGGRPRSQRQRPLLHRTPKRVVAVPAPDSVCAAATHSSASAVGRCPAELLD
jgi:catechol 2,3-dioxygenase-like lactoylglutathione lyase family enzyme